MYLNSLMIILYFMFEKLCIVNDKQQILYYLGTNNEMNNNNNRMSELINLNTYKYT